MTISIRPISTIEDFLILRQDWTKLLQSSPVKSAFLTWEWLFTWWKYFGQNKQLRILAAYDQESLVGIAPLMLRQIPFWGLRIRFLSNLGVPDIDVGGFILQEGRTEIQAALCREIERFSDQWDVFELDEFPTSPVGLDCYLQYFSTEKYRRRIMPRSHVFIPTTGLWEQYLKELSPHLRRNIKRMLRNLGEENKTVLFQRFNHGKATLKQLEAVFDVTGKSRFTDLYATESKKKFHYELIDPDLLGEAVDISLISIDDMVVGFEYGFNINNVYEAWRGTYDPAYKDYSIGILALFKLIEDNFIHKMVGVDLLRGFREYKKRWNGSVRPFSIFRLVPKNRLLASMIYIWRPIVREKFTILKDQVTKYFKKEE
jgi:CelD/BcsL family acetyltransferase involved in cellulose biosynthesis